MKYDRALQIMEQAEKITMRTLLGGGGYIETVYKKEEKEYGSIWILFSEHWRGKIVEDCEINMPITNFDDLLAHTEEKSIAW